ncbi:MAG: type II secretion system F family protein [Pseudomonadota bacterium]
MQIPMGGNNFLILLVLVFVALLLAFEGLYLLWRTYRGPEASRLKQRVRALAATSDDTQLMRQRLMSDSPWIDQWMQRMPRLHRLDRLLVQSGTQWTVSGLLSVSAVTFFAVAVVFGQALHQPILISLLAGLGAAALPWLWVRIRRDRRMAKIEQQLPDALDLITRALRAGHAFTAGLKMAGDELQPPIAAELRTVHDEINFGVSLQQALTHLCERVPLTDLRYFAVAVLVQRESGGNLTEILTDLSRLVRERARLKAKVRVLSAEGRLSGWILVLMPFALGGAVALVNPDFMSLLWTDPIGIGLIKFMLVLMAIGVLLMRKIVRIRV